MKTRYNKSQIMKEAHKLYKSNSFLSWSFSKALKCAWSNAKTRIKNELIEAKNEAIRQESTKQHQAKQKAEAEALRQDIENSGLSLHAYTMYQYYNGYGYKGD